MSDVPVIFEIDPDTHEALGHVHFFCSYQCRSVWDGDLGYPGVLTEEGMNTLIDVPEGSVCETCGKQFDNESNTTTKETEQ